VSAELSQRLAPLFEAARRLADPSDPLGRAARSELPAQTRLSPEGVELALARCLETGASDAELRRFAARTPRASRSHVLLSSNVFTAALRAIATGLASAPEVFVRPSRREPKMARFLAEAAPGSFHLTDELDPQPGDRLFAYGADTTFEALRRKLPSGVMLHAHGPGFGAAFVEAASLGAGDDCELSRALSFDVALFDQRGCLSPRVVWFEGPAERAGAFTRALARALGEREREVPLGFLAAAELAERERNRAALTYAGSVEPAGSGFVALLDGPPPALPELGSRTLLVVACTDALAAVRAHASRITTYAVAGSPGFHEKLTRALPAARPAAWGGLQTPPFDGPVDLRPLAERARGVTSS